MDKFVITGPARLQGELTISGAKNASLAMMPACLLAPGVSTLTNTPQNRDVDTFCRLLETLGVRTHAQGTTVTLDTSDIHSVEAPYEHVKKMRASIYVLGPLIARFGKARVSLPGGCNFGPRPVDLHLRGLEALGAEISVDSGYINASTQWLQGGRFHFDVVSVGASVNVIMAAVLARGRTVLTNVALEPEVVAVAEMLVQMGAVIQGIGTTTLQIDGVEKLQPVQAVTIPDRIEAATYLIAAAATQGDVTLHNVRADHMTAILHALHQSGATVQQTGTSVRVCMDTTPAAVDITAAPYPGFPTDAQAQWAAYMLTANGSATITDTIYPTRFGYVPELQRLGAHITTGESTCTVHGGAPLTGASVMSSDLRASASLVIAALLANGVSEILRVYHLDRGYEVMEERLHALGARVERQKTDEF